MRLITHVLRAVALEVGSMHLTSCALEQGQLPTAKWVRLLSLAALCSLFTHKVPSLTSSHHE